jgi:hypothetical protein
MERLEVVPSTSERRTELTEGIGNPDVKAAVYAMMDQASIPASAIAEAIGLAIDQPESVA